MVSGWLLRSQAGCPSRAARKEDPRIRALPTYFPAQSTPPSQTSRQTPGQWGLGGPRPLLGRFLLGPTAPVLACLGGGLGGGLGGERGGGS